MRPSAVAMTSLVLLAAATSPARADEAEKATEAAPADKPVNGMYATGGVLTIAGGIGLAAAGIWAALRIDEIEAEPGYVKFQEGVPDAFDTCTAARLGTPNGDYRLLEGAYLPSQMVASCDEVDDLVTLEVIAFPTSVILVGLGSYFLLEAFGVGYDNLAILPILGPVEQGAAATVRF